MTTPLTRDRLKADQAPVSSQRRNDARASAADQARLLDPARRSRIVNALRELRGRFS